MGGSASTEIGGVRVFKVSPGSPAAEAGLEVFFDFIVAINGVNLEPGEQSVFAKHIQDAENGTAKITVYNTRANMTREVTVMPRKWAGNGLLGATVRYDAVDVAENHGIRVLEVFPNSTAAHAGLVPFQDFLLGTPQRVFHDIDELVEVVQANINERMQVYVYNADSESVRETILMPNNAWGGDGCIGCDIGTGLLHRIPAPRRPPGGPMAPPQAPGAPLAGAPLSAAPICVPGAAAPPAKTAGGSAGGIPPVPGAIPPPGGIPAPGGIPPPGGAPPPGGTALPAIRPGGTWAPAAPQVPQAPQAPAAPAGSQAGAGATITPEAMAQLQAQIHQMGLGAAPSNGEVVSPISSMPENPKAPPSTPMNWQEVPPVDLSAAMDPSKFAGLSGHASPAILSSNASPANAPDRKSVV